MLTLTATEKCTLFRAGGGGVVGRACIRALARGRLYVYVCVRVL